MPVRSRTARSVKQCQGRVENGSSAHATSEITPDGAAPAHYEQEGLCDACSRLPWEDISKMSLREAFEWNGVESRSTACLLCRLLRSSSSFDDGKTLWFRAGTDLKRFGFEVKDGDLDTCCLLGNPFADNPRGYPMILLSRLNDEHSIKQLQRIYPEEACLESARKWIADCEHGHEAECAARDLPKLMNLRVIDCQKMRVVTAPRECKFIALSYVWGDITSPGNKPGRALPPWHLLPQTIQQCIQVSGELDCRYLWVDRYCIRQDDSKEQRIQINQMSDIYAAAHLTIVAAAGQDPSYGLPGVSPTLRKPIKHEKIGDTRVYVLPRANGLADPFYRSKWNTRAWTFQECFFSRRRLIFTDRQMIFVCNTSTCYEAKTKSLLDTGTNDDTWLMGCTPRNPSPSYQWLDSQPMVRALDYLEAYSRRHLTFDVDALSAISGALNTLTRDGIYHVWGVPFRLNSLQSDCSNLMPDGEICLTWTRNVSRSSLEAKRKSPFGRRRLEFPSWSPLGWDCAKLAVYPVKTAGISIQNTTCTTSLQQLVTTSTFASPDCSQRLQFELATGDLAVVRSTEKLDDFEVRYEWMVALHYKDGIHVYVEAVWDVHPDTLPDKTTIKGVLLPYAEQSKSVLLPGSACVLLLKPRESYYERVGIAFLDLRLPRMVDRVPYHVTRLTYIYKGNACKFVYSPEIEQTDWWRRHFTTKETIIVA